MRTNGQGSRVKRALIALAAVGLTAYAMGGAQNSQAAGLKALSDVSIPLPNLTGYVINNAAAIELGKALFWDMQAGGDGRQACASCHFHAGEDNRVRNTMNPGANGDFDVIGAGERILKKDFPQLGTDDVVGSQGITKRTFHALSGLPKEDCAEVPDMTFSKNGRNVRQVTGRNAPTVINAVYNYRSFWDGRANNSFNGVNPNGPGDLSAIVYQVMGGTATPVNIDIPNASLASQATGPPMSDVEMACAGRTFKDIGRKLIDQRPLRRQQVDLTDSVLGNLSRSPKNGLKTTYRAMIEAAFAPRWWDSAEIVDGYTVMENNFSMFWGLSIELYEATLISGNTPFDRFELGDETALTASQQRGMDIFSSGKGRCHQCHGRAELTEATVSQFDGDPLVGFFNIGVAPTANDVGVGLGMFKTPGLRNIELRGPYFHNGFAQTLRQVVDFYDRGGNAPDGNTDGNIRNLGLTEGQKHDLVNFLIALTDERVRFEQAPFDHPSLIVAKGEFVPAVGAAGRAEPITPFGNVNQHRQ